MAGLEVNASISPDFWHGRRVLLTGNTEIKGVRLAVCFGELGAEALEMARALGAEHNPVGLLGPLLGLTGPSGDIRNAEAMPAMPRRLGCTRLGGRRPGWTAPLPTLISSHG